MTYNGNYPKTAIEWWALADEYLDELAEIVSRYHPSGGRKHSHRITAAAAEFACEQERRRIRGQPGIGLAPADFRAAVARRDAEEASKLLEETWWGIPESVEVRGERAFSLLCDLCSEAGVLYE